MTAVGAKGRGCFWPQQAHRWLSTGRGTLALFEERNLPVSQEISLFLLCAALQGSRQKKCQVFACRLLVHANSSRKRPWCP